MARAPKPSEERPPDLEIGATARAKSIRFDSRPKTEVRFRGESVAETDSGSRRKNLPDEVRPGETYKDIEIGWRAAAWIEDAGAEPIEEDEPRRTSRDRRGR